MKTDQTLLAYVISDTYDRFQRFKEVSHIKESLIYVYDDVHLRSCLTRNLGPLVKKQLIFLPKFINHPNYIAILEVAKRYALDDVCKLSTLKVLT